MAQFVAKERSISVFGQRLRDLREAHGLSLRGLEELCGIAHQTIAKYERGENIPNWDTVERLAEALGVSTEEFRKKSE